MSARYTKQEKEFQKQIENISHDLRTPLTSLLGYVRLYKKSQSSYISQNAELSDTLDVIERKSESLKNLITQFYDISHLFDRFYIQESARSQGGTGLGLTIARSLAEEIGGELSVSSKKSNGNNSLLISFTLALPSC